MTENYSKDRFLEGLPVEWNGEKMELTKTNRFLLTIENNKLGKIFNSWLYISFKENNDEIIVEFRPLIADLDMIDTLTEKYLYPDMPSWLVNKNKKFKITFEITDATGVVVNTTIYNKCVLERVIKPRFEYDLENGLKNKIIAVYTLKFRK